jgi:hypothetical protein
MSEKDLGFLQGTWKCLASGSLAYGRLVGGELRFAYCFGGNDKLTGHYFGWREAGESTLVARFQWANGALAGFTYLKRVSEDRLEGGWWSALKDMPEPVVGPQAPPVRMVSSIWVRQPDGESPPEWAESFFGLARAP